MSLGDNTENEKGSYNKDYVGKTQADIVTQ